MKIQHTSIYNTQVPTPGYEHLSYEESVFQALATSKDDKTPTVEVYIKENSFPGYKFS